jgi:hypothetical protein
MRYYAIQAAKNARRAFWDSYPTLALARKAARDAAADGWTCTILRELPGTGAIGANWETIETVA